MAAATELNGDDIERFREKLLARRREITDDIGGLRAELEQEGGTGPPAGASSAAPSHPADAAIDEQAEQRSLGLAQRERDLVVEIDDALERIRAGTYGLCEADGEPIPRRRLEAMPWARFCKRHAERRRET